MGMISAGDLDRRITIERRVVTKDPDYGTSTVESWEPVIKVWAQIRDILPSRAEKVESGVSMRRRPARIRIRYREGIDANMRIVYRDRIMEIVSGPSEFGHREGLEFVAQEMSVQGDAP